MIEQLTIKNFQSHTDTVIELGPLTVLVGPSSSGKSAIARAIKALASNATGKDFITHGQTTAQVQARTDRGTVTLTKGKPEDSYVVLDNTDDKNPRRYTKLGGAVPPDVTDFLGIAAKDAINFAGQFDMPYLLRTSAAEVARTLGELTNVSAIFEASREALRRKNSFSATLRTRELDLASVAPQIEVFDALPAQLDAIERAEAALLRAEHAQNALHRLNDLLLTLQTATGRVRAAQSRTELPLPDPARAVAALGRVHALDSLISVLQSSSARYKTAVAEVEKHVQIIAVLENEYDTVLQEAGTCPTCGQNTEGVHVHG